MTIRIVFVVPVLAPYTKLRCEQLAKDPEIDLHVVTENDTLSDRTGWAFEEIPGCTMHRTNSVKHDFVNKHTTSGYSINNSHHFSLRLKKLIKEINPDIVIVCNSSQILMLLGRRKYQIGVVVEDTLRAEEGRKTINKMIKRFLLNRADVYFPFTDDAMSFLVGNGIKGKKILSSWSIDISFFNTLNNKEEERKKRGLKKTTYIILSSLIPRKGLKQFISAWQKMPNEFIMNNELIILGDGPLESELKELAKDNDQIKFLGNKSYSEVSEYLQCSDVFVLPTLEDLCSLSVFEAMAAGLPVLTTIYNGARFLIKDGVNGYVFDSESEGSIIEALGKISHSDLKGMSKNASLTISKFDNSVVMNEFGEKVKKYLGGI